MPSSVRTTSSGGIAWLLAAMALGLLAGVTATAYFLGAGTMASRAGDYPPPAATPHGRGGGGDDHPSAGPPGAERARRGGLAPFPGAGAPSALETAPDPDALREALRRATVRRRFEGLSDEYISEEQMAWIYAQLDDAGQAFVRSILQERHAFQDELRNLAHGRTPLPPAGQPLDPFAAAGGPALGEPEPPDGMDAPLDEVRFRLDDVGARQMPLSSTVIDDLGLSEEQAAGIEDLLHGSSASLYDELTGLYDDLMGTPGAGRGFTMSALIDGIRTASTSEEFAAAVRLIAQEQAGRATPPADGSGTHAERMLRAIFGHKGSLQDALEELLGEELARALLEHDDVGGTDHSYNVGAR